MNSLAWNQHLTRRQWLGGAAAVGATAALGGVPAQAQAGFAWPTVGKLLDNYVNARKVSGMVAALGLGQREPAFIARGYDTFARPRLSDGDSLYRIYSMTKTITGMAAMILIDERKLGIDQPLYEIIPAFKDMKVQKVYDGPVTEDNLEPAVRPITIRQLLTHTSGLGYGIVQSGPIVKAYQEAGVIPAVVSKLQDLPGLGGTPVPSLKLFAERLAEFPLVYQPGTHWSYSMGADLMGRVIEIVSGQAFDRFLQGRFFEPLGMKDTHFQVPAEDAERLTTNYYLLKGTLLPIDVGSDSVFLDRPPFPMGGSGLVSSPRDYDKFLEMLAGFGSYNGQMVMSEAAVRMGTSNLLPDTVRPKTVLNKDLDLDLTRYGFGALGRVGKGSQASIYGWAGAAGTIGFVDTRTGLRGGLFTQYMPSEAYPLIDEFPAAILADFPRLLVGA